MKKAIRSLVVITALGSVAYGAPFLAMGDSAELFLTGTLGVRADDNVLLASDNTVNDTIFSIVPGLEVVYGQNSIVKGKAFYKEDISRYADRSDLNTSLSTVGFNGSYDDQKLKIKYNASYAQVAQNTVDVRAGFLVRRDVANVGINSEVSLTDKSSLGIGATFENTDYKRAGFVSSKVLGAPINYYFNVTPKVALSVGFEYRDTQLDNPGTDSNDYFYNIGARGEFTPKLTGTIAVGWIQRNMDQGDDESTVGVKSSLAYAINEKTSLQLGVTNDYGVSGMGQSQRNLTYNLGAQSRIAEDWSIGGNASYRAIKYFGANSRTDDYFEGSLNVTYIYSRLVNFTAGYVYRNNSSDLAGTDFKNNVFSIAANIRY